MMHRQYKASHTFCGRQRKIQPRSLFKNDFRFFRIKGWLRRGQASASQYFESCFKITGNIFGLHEFYFPQLFLDLPVEPPAGRAE